jgi:hypothetical protein
VFTEMCGQSGGVLTRLQTSYIEGDMQREVDIGAAD